MIDINNPEECEKIIKSCQKFLKRSSDRWSDDVNDEERALEIAGGGFWDEENKKKWHIINKVGKDIIPVVAYNNIMTQVNATASPFSRSPFHANILNKDSDTNGKAIQEAIATIESSNNQKNCLQRAATRACCCKAGYIVIGTKLGEENKIIPNLEFIANQKSVAFDPDCVEPSGEDAEEGALVTFISKKKARRVYGEDVCPSDNSNDTPLLDFSDIYQWQDKTDKIQLVKYFKKERQEDGSTKVVMYTICGNFVIDALPLNTDIIPIVRFAGYNDYDAEYGQTYTGWVQKNLSHIEMMSLALTMQAIRMRRCSNVRIIAGKKATKGCESYFTNFESANANTLVFNDADGISPPILVNDTFQTADISAVMQEERQALQDCTGTNLAGIDAGQRTATEIMTQQTNSESNVQELYINWECSCHTIAKIMIGILNNGNVPSFTLEGGPSVITNNMKARAELQAIQTMCQPEHQELVAIRFAETIDSEIGKGLANDLKANCGLQLSEGQSIGSVMNAAERMKQLIEQSNQQMTEMQQQIQELTEQNKSLELALEDQKRAQTIQIADMKHKWEMDEAQMAVNSQNEARKLDLQDIKLKGDVDKANKDYEIKLAQMERENAKILMDAIRQ